MKRKKLPPHKISPPNWDKKTKRFISPKLPPVDKKPRWQQGDDIVQTGTARKITKK